MDKKKCSKKIDGAQIKYAVPHKARFPSSRFGIINTTLDGKKKLPNDIDWYARYVQDGSELSNEEIMYLVKRINELDDIIGRAKTLFAQDVII